MERAILGIWAVHVKSPAVKMRGLKKQAFVPVSALFLPTGDHANTQ
jgi:hypothetical protein